MIHGSPDPGTLCVNWKLEELFTRYKSSSQVAQFFSSFLLPVSTFILLFSTHVYVFFHYIVLRSDQNLAPSLLNGCRFYLGIVINC